MIIHTLKILPLICMYGLSAVVHPELGFSVIPSSGYNLVTRWRLNNERRKF